MPDASRISPPYAGRGTRSGRDISLELVADPRVAVTSFDVPTHRVVARRPDDGTLRLTLAEQDSIPNRDFVLRYRVAEAKPRATLYLASAGSGANAESGYFSLVVAPPDVDVDGLVGRREIVFVVDVSGSMSGVPLLHGRYRKRPGAPVAIQAHAAGKPYRVSVHVQDARADAAMARVLGALWAREKVTFFCGGAKGVAAEATAEVA